MSDYYQEAQEDAVEFVQEYQDAILDQLMSEGKASDDFLNDYDEGDSFHHERYVDRSYNLQEAAQLLDALDEYEETDKGLWEGQSPRDAISTQAAFTYGKAVYCMAQDIIKEINGETTYVVGKLEDETDAANEDLNQDKLKEALSTMIDRVCKDYTA